MRTMLGNEGADSESEDGSVYVVGIIDEDYVNEYDAKLPVD